MIVILNWEGVLKSTHIVLSIGLGLVFIIGSIACSKSGSDSGNGKPVTSTDKLTTIAQAQSAIGQFGNSVKDSSTSGNKSKSLMSGFFLKAFALSDSKNSTSGEQDLFSKSVNEKSNKLSRKFKEFNCSKDFKTIPKPKGSSVEQFTLSIQGANCPFKLSYNIKGQMDEKTQVLSGVVEMDYQSLTEEMAAEVDLVSMKTKIDFTTLSTQPTSNSSQNQAMKMDIGMKIQGQGESVSAGAYSTDLVLKAKFDIEIPADSFNVNSNFVPSLSMEVTGRFAVGDTETTLIGKMEIENGKEKSKVQKINGVDVTEKEFTQVLTSLSLDFQGGADEPTSDSQSSSGSNYNSEPEYSGSNEQD